MGISYTISVSEKMYYEIKNFSKFLGTSMSEIVKYSIVLVNSGVIPFRITSKKIINPKILALDCDSGIDSKKYKKSDIMRNYISSFFESIKMSEIEKKLYSNESDNIGLKTQNIYYPQIAQKACNEIFQKNPDMKTPFIARIGALYSAIYNTPDFDYDISSKKGIGCAIPKFYENYFLNKNPNTPKIKIFSLCLEQGINLIYSMKKSHDVIEEGNGFPLDSKKNKIPYLIIHNEKLINLNKEKKKNTNFQ
ncbi:MAG: hypothetical protein PHN56_01120 [Candidatus Nanoarchaeia archaeon]|nr:hypothetical protein [Candidatus Nanoarchaeia archaeon]